MNAFLTTEQREKIFAEIACTYADIWEEQGEYDGNVEAMRKMNNTELREYIHDEIVEAGLNTSVGNFLKQLA